MEAVAKFDRLAFESKDEFRELPDRVDQEEFARNDVADWPDPRNCDDGGRLESNEVTRRESLRAKSPRPLNLAAEFQELLIARFPPPEDRGEKLREEEEESRPPELRPEKEPRDPELGATQPLRERPPPKFAKFRESKRGDDPPRDPDHPPAPCDEPNIPFRETPPREGLIECRDDPPPP